MSIKAFKYLSPILFYFLAWRAFTYTGFVIWLPMIYSWIIIPGIELFLKPNESNLGTAELEMAKRNPIYDYMLYIIVPMQYGILVYFLFSMQQPGLTSADIIGRITGMGMLCGTFGINVGHELGHRVNKFEQVLAKMLLATSLYMHFFIEHNKGHHKNVATPHDPSSARYNEPVYFFYPRTVIFSYLSAWHIANEECRKKNIHILSFRNEMMQVHFFQFMLIAAVWFFFGSTVLIYFLCAAFMGILLLETVNYIEHYGLQRKESAPGKFERTLPVHSWNSSHPLGRIMLFELSRHSDHHYLASKKYQLLEHHHTAPQLPTGYPGSMLLSLLPPIWFYVMNRKIKLLQAG